jgi:O-antigen biosynthesis protein WbqV
MTNVIAGHEGELASHPQVQDQRITLIGQKAGPPRRPFSVRRATRTLALVMVDYLAVVFGLVIMASQSNSPDVARVMTQWWIALPFGSIVVGVLYVSGIYRRSWRYYGFWHALTLVGVLIVGLGLAWAGSFTIPAVRALGRGVVPLAFDHMMFTTAALMALRASRRIVREWLSGAGPSVALRSNADGARWAILVGSPQWALSVIQLLRAEEEPSFRIAGVLLPSISDTLNRLAGVPVLGSHDMLVEVVAALEQRDQRPSLVIACDDGTHLSHREMARLSHRARQLGLDLSRIRDCWSHILQSPSTSGPGEISVKKLLGRNEYEMDGELISREVGGNRVLVTGAGGTIGGELCWQLASFRPSKLILLEHSEYQLYTIEMRLREAYPDVEIHAELCSVYDQDEVRRVFAKHRPDIVYHAAALKHVPIVEMNPCAGVQTNIIGTKTIADAVCEFSAKAMIQISTDKAVNPVGMMGATKRVGELYCQALDMCGADDEEAPRFMTVRFGNVLGSSGSVVPLFRRQLEEGKPLTVTHPDIERFFMTVREAVQLILQSSSSSLNYETPRGTIFVLDMGNPVKIVDLACRMIRLYGLEPETDVPIEFVGVRPGEKLFEELFDNCEEQVESGIKGIFEALSQPIPLPFITKSIDRLARAVAQGDQAEARTITHNLTKIPASGATFDIFTAPAGGRSPNSNEKAIPL